MAKAKGFEMFPAMFVAASAPFPDLTAFLDTFKPVEQRPDEVLKGNRRPAGMRLSGPAYGRSNVGSRKLFHQAAEKQSLQSRRFEALRVWFSERLQVMLCRPESVFVTGQTDLLQVTWSPDEEEMRCDFANVLLPRQWPTPKGWTRVVPVSLAEDLPGIGTVILMDLKHSYLEEIQKEEEQEGQQQGKQKAKKADKKAEKKADKNVEKAAEKAAEQKEEKEQ